MRAKTVALRKLRRQGVDGDAVERGGPPDDRVATAETMMTTTPQSYDDDYNEKYNEGNIFYDGGGFLSSTGRAEGPPPSNAAPSTPPSSVSSRRQGLSWDTPVSQSACYSSSSIYRAPPLTAGRGENCTVAPYDSNSGGREREPSYEGGRCGSVFCNQGSTLSYEVPQLPYSYHPHYQPQWEEDEDYQNQGVQAYYGPTEECVANCGSNHRGSSSTHGYKFGRNHGYYHEADPPLVHSHSLPSSVNASPSSSSFFPYTARLDRSGQAGRGHYSRSYSNGDYHYYSHGYPLSRMMTSDFSDFIPPRSLFPMSSTGANLGGNDDNDNAPPPPFPDYRPSGLIRDYYRPITAEGGRRW